jgi:capsular polysaccharide biosynthesis protein
LLSCTYKKFINDKIEIKISQLIKDSINSSSIQTDQNIQCKKLLLSKTPKNKSIFESIRILTYILSVRGLLRTLLILTQPFPGTNEYITKGRFSILSNIVIHPKIFKSQFLGRLSFEFKTLDEFSLYAKFPSTQLLNESVIALYTDSTNLVFEKPIYKKYLFNSNVNLSDSIDLFADVFVRWNSKFFIVFVLRNHLYDFVEEFVLQRYPPVFYEFKRTAHLQFDDHSLSNIKLDDLYLKKGINAYEEILDAEILHQKFIKVGENILNLDSTSSIKQKFVAGLWAYTNRIYRDQDLATLVIPYKHSKNMSEGIYLIGRCDENWYHFLLDTLPRLLFFDSISMDVPLLIRADIPKTTKEFIYKLTNRKIIELEPNTRMKVAKLYVCPGRSTVFDVKPPRHENWVDFSPIVLSKLRERVMDYLADESSPNILGTILISRKSSKRNLLNAESIEKVISESHVPIYELDQDFFRDQIKIFANTKHVISPGGAVLANIIFMRRGSKVTVLRSYGFSKLNIWKQLAEITKVEYSEVRGIPSYWGFNFFRRLHSNFYISPRKLRRMFSEEI